MNEEQTKALQEAKAYWQSFPEAPFSDSFKWVDGAGFEHLTTVRGWNFSGLYQSLAKATAQITETGGKPAGNPRPPQAPPPDMPKAAQEAMQEGDNEAAAAIQASIEDVGEPPAGKAWKTMDINRVVISALPDDLYTLECYSPGHKWPDLKVQKRKLSQIAGMLKHITNADPAKPADMTVNATAYYVDGKPKDNGGFWLDLYHLRLKP